MYEKILPNRVGITPEFEDGVTAFMNGPILNIHIWTVRKLSALVGSAKLKFSKLRRRMVPDDGTRSCPTDVRLSSYYSEEPYDCVFGLTDRFHDKDDIDLDYCKFYGETRCKPTRKQNPNCKKTPYAILRYLSFTPRLQRLYASKSTFDQMTWHVNDQIEEGSISFSDEESWRHFDWRYLDFTA
ncbi:hypothetical protein Sango_2461100 [Sesamum angolense]|uniref:Uncharacterized protein n=1 Tax=Sesamum angolense TaxID=2727404 RepID=A0AAE1W849_9LAMI|nr:hypothetical protein Sango_2461100 [Sesamum angolense]